MRARAPLVFALAALLVAPLQAQHDDILYELTDEQYYSMPELFELQDMERCRGIGGSYCLGSFELTPAPRHGNTRLYSLMQRYSSNWVHNFNHTRLHRGLCLHSACRPPRAGASATEWFSECVNASMQPYNLSARPLHVSYCERAPPPPAPLSAAERVLAAALATLLALAAVSTVLDVTLSDQAKKAWPCALSWSLLGSWRALSSTRRAPAHVHAPAAGATDLRALDGLRVFCVMCVVVEHVCWLTTQHYFNNAREYELMRGSWDAMLMTNSTLVVQIFFLMSSFLLAHKLLERPPPRTDAAIFADTVLNRIVRISPAYWAVVWLAAAGWQRAGAGPLWAPLVGAEVAVCQRKWWTHLLYLNNVIYPDDKCLIQTWYLAADMQLYVAALVLTLWLRRLRAARALALLAALMLLALTALAAIAYHWHLVPTYAMHNPELVRRVYSGEASFNVLYQSPLGNSPGALAGLILAFAHHALKQTDVPLHQYRVFRWTCTWAPYCALVWAALSPRLLGAGPPPRAGAAALAALERPVFAALVSLGILGAMHHVQSPLRALLSWRGWAVLSRLSFGVLLLHMPLNKSLVAARQSASTLNRNTIMLEFCGVWAWSHLLALPLALLLELPLQRLHTLLRARTHHTHTPTTTTHKHKAHICDTLQ